MALEVPPGPIASALLIGRSRRPQPRTLVLLVVIVAVTAGLASGAIAAGRRAGDAVDEFVRWSRPEDANVVVDPSLPPAAQLAKLHDVAARPEVAAGQRFGQLVVRVRRPGERRSARGAMVAEAAIDPPVSTMVRDRVLRGREPDPGRPDEVAVNEVLADRFDLHAGDRLVVEVYPAARIDEVGTGATPPPAATTMQTVVGIVRRPVDLERSPKSEGVTLDELNDARLELTPAYWRRNGPDLAVYDFELRTRLTDPATSAGFVRAFGDGSGGMLGRAAAPLHDRGVLERSTRAESLALIGLGLLIGIVGFVLVGAAVRRVVSIEPEDRTAFRAVGVTGRELALAEVLRATPVVVGGAILSVPVALLVEPRVAFGLSRLAEIGDRPGLALTTSLVLAAALVVVGLGALALISRLSHRSGRREDAPVGGVPLGGRALLQRLAGAGAPPWTVAGVRMALPPSGRGGAPVRSALATIAIGVALLTGTVTFAASLRHLVDSPAARGWTWDVEVGNFSGTPAARAGRAALERTPGVAEFTGYNSQELPVDGHPLEVLGIQEPAVLGLPVFEGRLPAAPGEIALARSSMSALHVDVGDEVTVTGFKGNTKRFRVVGVSLGPGAVDTDLDLRRGAIVRFEDLDALTPTSSDVVAYAVRLDDGADRAATLRRLHRDFGLAVFGPSSTLAVASVERMQPLLVLLAGTVLVLAIGTLLHALLTALRRRRRELALLKALGFDRTQIGRSVVLQSASLAALACVVGVPLGLVVGRWSWRAAARTIGVVPEPTVPVAVLWALLAVLVAAVLTGVWPSRRARRVAAAEALRRE